MKFIAMRPGFRWLGSMAMLLCGAVHAASAGSNAAAVRGAASPQVVADRIAPFEVRVGEPVLADLRRRLARTRFADHIPGSGWEYGTDADYIRSLIGYWRDTFDWRSQERRLNRFPQFKTKLNGLDIHFIRQRARSATALPVILIHDYPDSFLTYTQVIDELSNPAAHGASAADAFDVVVPSLPGFGFSDRPDVPGWGVGKSASALVALMARLGYARYAVHGAGLGCAIGTQMALQDPAHVVAAHFVDCPPEPNGFPESAVGTPDELQRAKARAAELIDEQAYLEMNAAKPQTVAYELLDSPIGLAAWIVDKYRAWCDCGGDPERQFSKDELLTNITLYWVTETAGSAGRIFRENRQDSNILGGHVSVPTAYLLMPKGAVLRTRAAMETRYNIVRWSEMPNGGHFVALEEPAMLVADLRAFVRDLR